MICIIHGCLKPVYKSCPNKGLCQSHYIKNLKSTNPLYSIRPRTNRKDLDKAIIEAINFTEKKPCLIWPYYRDCNGYPNISGTFVHRIVYEAVHGKAPPDKPLALHDNGRNYGCGPDGCINPHHLYWGDKQDNASDSILQNTVARGESVSSHKLKEKDIILIRSLYSTGNWTYPQLSNKFSVTSNTIYRIVTRRIWKHI
jgi:hypothetical protein